MLKIRMQRTGRINTPSYRIVVVEHTESPKTGNVVEKVGTYNPKTKERVLDAERIKYWMSVGAKPSDTVHNMLVSLGILNAKKINVLPKYKEPASPDASQGGPVKEEVATEAAPAAGKAAEEPVADVSSEASAKEEAPAEEPVAEATPAEETKEEAPAA